MSPTDMHWSFVSILMSPSQHFEGLTKLKESGAFKMGGNTAFPLPLRAGSKPGADGHLGAVLEEMPPDDEVSSMKFSGSTLMIVAESKQAVIDLIKDDIYVTSGVWDLEKAQIWPAKIAFRFP